METIETKTNDININKLMKDIHTGKIQLPQFQREWVWDDDKIRNLIASITCNYPVGAVMFWSCGNDPPFAHRPIEFAPTNNSPENLILDGQQRLTSIYSAMYSEAPVTINKKNDKKAKCYYYIDIMKAADDSYDRLETIVSVPENKKIKKTRKNSELDLSTPEKEFEQKMYPLCIVLDADKKARWEDGYKDYYKNDQNTKDSFNKFKTKIIEHLSQYQIPVIELERDTELPAVCEIFRNVNSNNMKLDDFDLMTAIFAKTDKNFNLHEDWDKRQKKFFAKGILNDFRRLDFLRACKLMAEYHSESENTEYNSKKGEIINLNFEDYKKYADILSEGFDEARKLLYEEGIFSRNGLPYTSQLIPLAVIFAVLKAKGVIDSAINRQNIKQWYWCGVFDELYGNAANHSKFLSDVKSVIKWIIDDENPTLVSNFEFEISKLKEVKSGALFKAFMALIIKNGCKDFGSGKLIKDLYQESVPVAIHHIFPKDYCTKKYDETLWDSVINKTPISKKTNDIVGNVRPSDYLEKITANNEDQLQNKNRKKKSRKINIENLVTQTELEKYLKSHYINPEDLYDDDFESFIANRALYLLNAVENVTGKKILGRNTDEVKNFFGRAI